MDKRLLEIAKRNSHAVRGRGNLEARYSDSEDFIDVSVWSLQDMLKEAYRLGLSDGKNGR